MWCGRTGKRCSSEALSTLDKEVMPCLLVGSSAISANYDPNDNTPNTPGNLAKGAFGTGESGYFVTRFGPASGADFAADQIVEVYSVQFGTQHKTVPAGENAKFTITQPLSMTRTAYDYTIPAGP